MYVYIHISIILNTIIMRTASCFRKLGVLLVGVLLIRALLFGVHLWAPDFCKLHLLCTEA